MEDVTLLKLTKPELRALLSGWAIVSSVMAGIPQAGLESVKRLMGPEAEGANGVTSKLLVFQDQEIDETLDRIQEKLEKLRQNLEAAEV